jgi:chorismate synthase
VPMVEAMTALVLVDHALRQESTRAGAPASPLSPQD